MNHGGIWRRSRHVSAFGHHGAAFVYHDLYGYILEMSPDILGFLDAFAEPSAADDVCARFAGAFDGQPPQQFVNVFVQFACLVEPDEDEVAGIWPMVAIKSRWNVWERDAEGLTIYTAWGERPLARHRLDRAELEVWDAMDGETRLNELGDRLGRDRVAALVSRLVHHDVQALKLSAMPWSAYGARRDLRPPYLTSTMPYPPFARDASAPRFAPGAGGRLSPTDYYRGEVDDPEAQFDHQETTLSHLLRRPHPALRGRTYGQALVDALATRGRLPDAGRVRVLEIGGGLGYVARAVCEALDARGLDVTYVIQEVAPALAAAQRAQCQGLPVEVREGDALTAALEAGGYDLVLSNEMIGDLPAVELTREQIGFGLPEAERRARLEDLGDAGRLILELGLDLADAPERFYLTTGALELLRRIAAALAPGGTAVVTEFGELQQYPRLSTHLDHPELSIHFGHLQRAAEALGLAAEFEYVMDLLDLDRSLEGLATTRSYFRALAGLLADHGVELEKVGYTRQMYEALLAGAVDPAAIGDVRFDRIEDRLMGLVPHEFKALVLHQRA